MCCPRQTSQDREFQARVPCGSLILLLCRTYIPDYSREFKTSMLNMNPDRLVRTLESCDIQRQGFLSTKPAFLVSKGISKGSTESGGYQSESKTIPGILLNLNFNALLKPKPSNPKARRPPNPEPKARLLAVLAPVTIYSWALAMPLTIVCVQPARLAWSFPWVLESKLPL